MLNPSSRRPQPDSAPRARASGAIRALGLALLTLVGSGAALAEGSRHLYPADYFTRGTVAPNPAGAAQRAAVFNGTNYLSGVVTQRTFFYVYARAGETILIGRSGTTTDFTLYRPPAGQTLAPGAVDLGFGTRGAENLALPGLETISSATICAAGGGTGNPVVNAADGLGAATSIGTNSQANGNTGQTGRNNELAGPFAGSPGFVPCRYRVTEEGVYGVVFNGTTWMWEVGVRESIGLSGNPDLNGRVFTYVFAGDSAAATNPIYSTLYYVTDDGYRYSQAMRGLAPFRYVLYANDKGFTDQGEPLYRNVRGQGQQLTSLRFDEPPGGGSAGAFTGANANQIETPGAQYPIFFSDVMAADTAAAENRVDETLVALGIPTTPPPPVISDIDFVYPPTSGGTTYVGYGGVFRFNAQDVTSYRIFIKGADPMSPDYNSLDNPLNRVIEGTAGPGLNEVVWDGLNGAGVPIPAGSGYSFEVTGRNGEVHFPFLDAEANQAGGPTLTKLNGPNAGDTTVYYDDRGYLTRAGYRVGNIVAGVPGHLCGNTAQADGWPQPQPNQALEGIDSAAFNAVTGQYYRFWGQGTTGNTGNDCANSTSYFGDAKGIDLWTYETTDSPLDLSFSIVDIADVTATVQGPAFAAPGATVVNLISFANVGSIAASSVTYSATLPLGLSGVSCAGATCAYNAATGEVTITGLPTTLSPSQFLPTVTLSYTAPASGSPRIDVFIASPSEVPPPGIAPNTDFAVTVIDADAEVVDVLAQINPPAFAAPNSIVDVPVTFRNLGPDSAADVTYALELPQGLDPADVSCEPNPPVTCSYNAGTGAITVSGLPTSLASGAQTALVLSYRAPNAPGAVQVSALIGTSSDEAGATANNVASGQTIVTAADVADVTVSVSVPANAAEGGTVNGQVLFENRGPSSATITQYTLELPLGLAGVTCSPAIECSVVVGITSITITWTGPATLPNGGTYPTGFSYTAPAGPTTVDVLAAIATSTAGDEPSNNTAEASTTIQQVAADMAASFGPIPAALGPGQVLTGLTLTCTNNGPGSAANATCVPGANAGVVSNVQCTPPSPALLVANGDAIACTFDYTAPGTQGGADEPAQTVGFLGTTSASNDNNAGNNSDTASAVIVDALNDGPLTVFPGGSTASVIGNDTRGAVPAVIGTNVSLIPGVLPPGFTMNPDGTITVAPGTTPGPYAVPYTICAFPAIVPPACDTATASVDVQPSIDAVDDGPTTVSGGGGNTPSVIGNDTTNGVAAVIGVNVSLTPGSPPIAGLSMNPDGTISVAAGTPPATYAFPYTICVIPATAPPTCDTATATVVVVANDVPVGNDDQVSTPLNTPVNIPVLSNDVCGIDTPCTITLETPPAVGTVVPNNNGTPGDPSDDFFVYTPPDGYAGPPVVFTYRICDANGDCDIATVTILVANCGGNGTVDGLIFRDGNRDGLRQGGENGERSLVSLVPTAGSTRIVASDVSGNYLFSAVPAGSYEVVVLDSYLADELGLYATAGVRRMVNVAACGNVSEDFGFAAPNAGVVGDFVWFDADQSGAVNEYFDADNNGELTLNDPSAELSEAEFEWVDLNGNGIPDAGEFARCGLPGVNVELLNAQGQVLGSTRTNPRGAYRFTGLPLNAAYSTRVSPSDPALLAGSQALFTSGLCKLYPPVGKDAQPAAPAKGVSNCGLTTAPSRTSPVLTASAPVFDALDYGHLCAANGVVIGLADLQVVKLVDNAAPQVGSTVSFTVTVTNNGPAVATNVVVSDQLPSGYLFLSASPGQGSWTAPAWSVGTLQVGQSVALTMQARVLGSGNYLNTAIASGDQSDPVPDNDISTRSVTPGAPASAAPVLVPVGGPAGLLLMGLLLGGLGARRLRQRGD